MPTKSQTDHHASDDARDEESNAAPPPDDKAEEDRNSSGQEEPAAVDAPEEQEHPSEEEEDHKEQERERDRLVAEGDKGAILEFLNPLELEDGYYPDDEVAELNLWEHARCVKTTRKCTSCSSLQTRTFFQSHDRYLCDPCHAVFVFRNRGRCRLNKKRTKSPTARSGSPRKAASKGTGRTPKPARRKPTPARPRKRHQGPRKRSTSHAAVRGGAASNDTSTELDEDTNDDKEAIDHSPRFHTGQASYSSSTLRATRKTSQPRTSRKTTPLGYLLFPVCDESKTVA